MEDTKNPNPQTGSEDAADDLPADVQEALGMKKKGDTRPDPTDYISEFENPDSELKSPPTRAGEI